ncbi:MAG: hypothetical protein HXX13_09615 [Bacteroidetes bacterium]|nr:hypothetical protein [Bacteroidota bacterium]
MKTPFTTEQFFSVFENYNLALFPAQWILLLLGVIAALLIRSNFRARHLAINCFLGLLWLWMGIIYHLLFFADINPAAKVFGVVFIIQGLLFIYNGFRADTLSFNFNKEAKDYAGYFLILFGLLLYPVIGYLVNGSLERTISLGLPCPTTIFTFGFLLLTSAKLPKYMLIIPSLWAIIGFSAVIKFGVYQDVMLPISAMLAIFWLTSRKNI